MTEGDGFWSLFMTGVLLVGFSLLWILPTRKQDLRHQSWWDNKEKIGTAQAILFDRVCHYGFLPVGVVLVVVGLAGWLIANLA
jgi:hypothetical protein